MKAILEFEAPKSCDDCKFIYAQSDGYSFTSCFCLADEHKHGDMRRDDTKVKRAEFCPLRIEDD